MSLAKLISTGKTVFSLEDLAKILDIANRNYLRVYVLRMFKRKEFVRLRRGIYSYTSDYNRYELANKIKKPSYVSFERVLFDNGIVFQDFTRKITSVSNNSYSEKVDGIEYLYYKIKNEILYNPAGIIIDKGARIATVERAICDTTYLSKNYYFDNLDINKLNKEKLLKISPIYNKRVIVEVKKICSI